MFQLQIIILTVSCLTIIVNEAQSCDCGAFYHFTWSFEGTRNLSLERSAYYYFVARDIDLDGCQDVEGHWKIQRADGVTELYTVLNETYHYGREEEMPERGLDIIYGLCDYRNSICAFKISISPTDLRYDGARITGILDLPQCYNSSNVTESITIHIQGLLESPTDVNMYIEVGVERMTLSWSPPYTIDGIPILQYTVYIISQGHTETVNTTKTRITIDKNCNTVSYQISAWNEVGEGNTAIYVPTMYQAIVEAVSGVPGVCASCTFIADSATQGCTIELNKDDINSFVFNVSRHKNEELKLECFPVPNGGVDSVHAHESELGIHTGSTLSHAAVSTVDDISEPHVCACCSFTNDSTARGCTVELQNDEFTFVFNMSRQSSEELTLLECFPVPEAGVFSVSVKEIQHDGLLGNNVLSLPDVSVGSRNTPSVGIGSTLSHAAVSTVNDISEPRVCASCSFTNASTARGCNVELQNDEFTFVFNVPRQSSEELTLLECFPVPEAGVFNVSVYEVLVNGILGYKVWRLPDVTSVPLNFDNKTALSVINATVTGIVFGLSLVRVIVAVLIAVIIVMRWRKMENKNIKTPEPSSDSSTTVQLKSSDMSATVLDENTGDLLSASTTGEVVKLRTNTKHKSAAQCEEIQLSTNPAYGTR